MYSAYTLSRKYLQYYFTAANGKGHGVHSPFVFDFVKNVLNQKSSTPFNKKIEAQRVALLQDETLLEVQDFGAGSGHLKTKYRKVKEIAASSIKPKKYAQLLQRIACYYASKEILEIGTSLGITTCYLAEANNTTILTMEGAATIAGVALKNFKKLGLKNIEIIEGNFDTTVAEVVKLKKKFDLVYIDGNHKKEPTLRYFNTLLASSHDYSIFILDDIHWSAEMEEAWEKIKLDSRVSLTIDLFFIGLVFFRKEFKVKQDFVIRY